MGGVETSSTDATNNPNNSGGESFSTSGGQTSSQSQSSSFQDPDFVWAPQAEALTNLYQTGADIFGGTNQLGQQQAQDLYTRAIEGFESLMNPGVNPQLSAYSREVDRNLKRSILPSMRRSAGMVGGLGGSRDYIGRGLAASDANQQVTDMAANLYNADRNRQLQAMSMSPALGGFGMGIPWFGANQYSGILGSPAILGGAAGSQSSSSSTGSTFSDSYGYQYDIGGGGSSDSDSYGFGIAPKK